MSDQPLRSKLIRLAYNRPDLRDDLLPLLIEDGRDDRPARNAWDDDPPKVRDGLSKAGSSWYDNGAVARSTEYISTRYGREIPVEAARIIAESAHRNQASGSWPRSPLPVDAGRYTSLLERLGIIIHVRGRYTLTNKGMSMGLAGAS